MPIAYLQCDFTLKDLRTARECQILLIHNTVDNLSTVTSRLRLFEDRLSRSTEVRMRHINNAARANINKMFTLYVYVLTDAEYSTVVLQLKVIESINDCV